MPEQITGQVAMMAGNPKRRAEMVMLDQHEEKIFDLLDAGWTHKQIGEELGVMRTSITRWLNADEGRKQALADSRVHASHGMAEDAVEIADDSQFADSPQAVASAKLRIETRRWLAGVWNRAEYGEQRNAGVTVNIGTLHLDALRQAQAGATQALEVSAPDVIDVTMRDVTPAALDGDAFGLM